MFKLYNKLSPLTRAAISALLLVAVLAVSIAGGTFFYGMNAGAAVVFLLTEDLPRLVAAWRER